MTIRYFRQRWRTDSGVFTVPVVAYSVEDTPKGRLWACRAISPRLLANVAARFGTRPRAQ